MLGTWKEACCGLMPHMRYIPFAEIRHQSPREFIELLVHELGAAGVVAGANYRFGNRDVVYCTCLSTFHGTGYKASGDAQTLDMLGRELGIEVKIVELVDRKSVV